MYGNLGQQPNLITNPIGTSINHLIFFSYITVLVIIVRLRIKNIFTRVLKGHIAVASFKLKKNSSGSIIDGKARKYLKQINLDYAHSTGHGVGFFLNVHEGPHAISKNNKVEFKELSLIHISEPTRPY